MIGVFDSGIGGLSILTEVRQLLPAEHLVYYADHAFFPYGQRTPAEVLDRADRITRLLLERGCKLIVVACNTATSAAVAELRKRYHLPFVSIEPALKPAAAATLAGKVALLVTPGTARGEKLAALIDQHGAEVTVIKLEAPGLAERIEAGDLDGPETRALVRGYLAPALHAGADVVALGCTHYAFIRPLIEEEAGPGVTVLEPSAAVARQVRRLLHRHNIANPGPGPGSVVYLTSGDESAFTRTRTLLRQNHIPIPEV
jgi:glutamate racemase